MKVINKILCFLSVFVLFVPFFCFNVSADDSTPVGNIFKDYQGYQDSCLYYSNFDDTGFYWSDFLKHVQSNSELNSADNLIFESRVDSYNYSVFNKAFLLNSPIPFFDCLSSVSETSEMYKFTLCENLYYIVYSYSPTSNGKDCYIAFLSESPFYFIDNSSYIGLSSDTGVGACVFRYLTTDLNVCKFSLYYYTSDITSSNLNTPFKFKSDTNSFGSFLYKKNTGVTSTADSNYTKFNAENIYTNCKDIDLSLLTNVDSINASEFKSSKLSDNIDVKLTPEFGLDMDRVFDKNTGQNDYFKFEVTNNSDSNIQFCASIVDEQTDSIKNAISGTIFDNVLQFDYKDWEEGYWNYISDSQYYADCYEVEEELFGLAHDYKRYAELRKGNFYWVLLKPGEKFEDFIYWENINIKANTKYSFIVDAVPTELDYPTDVFYALDELTGVKVFSHNDDLDDRQYSKDESLEKYALDKNECFQVCNHVFSVKSIPKFTTEIKGGNSKITSGWKDTVKQSSNPYYREDTRNGEIKAVNNYSEYNGNLPDVDVNIDNLSVDNIKSYVSYSQDFFKVIKSVLCVFPSWVWVLICFGLTGLIVIAIVKALL